MPFCKANWKVLLPVWRGLAGAGWDSLARLAELEIWADAGSAAHSAASTLVRKRVRLKPVKPAAALCFFLGRGRGLAALGDLDIAIDRLAGVTGSGAVQDTVGKAAIRILHGALIGIQPCA